MKLKGFKSINVKRGTRVRSARKMIGIIQTIPCYIPQIRIWHEDRFIKTSSMCVMRKPKQKCLNRVINKQLMLNTR